MGASSYPISDVVPGEDDWSCNCNSTVQRLREQSIHFPLSLSGVLLRCRRLRIQLCRRLRIQFCHSSGLGHCCGLSMIQNKNKQTKNNGHDVCSHSAPCECLGTQFFFRCLAFPRGGGQRTFSVKGRSQILLSCWS